MWLCVCGRRRPRHGALWMCLLWLWCCGYGVVTVAVAQCRGAACGGAGEACSGPALLWARGRLLLLPAELLPCCSPQCGRADGYILEGAELQFYIKKMQKKQKGKSAA